MSALYTKAVKDQLKDQFQYKSVMQIPKVTCVSINMGVGNDKKQIEFAKEELEKLTGQQAVITYVRRSEAGFKIREGWPIGTKVTLRGKQMHDFLFKLISIVLPRVRDFRGLNPRSFDGRGNFNFGIKEQIVFPEIKYENVDKLRGMDINIQTSANTNEEALALLKLMGFPFPKDKKGEDK